jgi:hypothetical protein
MEPFSIENWISLSQTILTIIGGAYALYNYRQATADKRTELIFNIYTKLYDDSSINKALYAIDKNQDLEEIQMKVRETPPEDGSSFKTVKLEKDLDKMLQYFNYLGLLVRNNRLETKDLEAFKYHIEQLFDCKVVTEYRTYLALQGLKLDNLDWLKSIIRK